MTTGTSVAAAHVSGVAALLLERNPALEPTAVNEILTLSAKKAGSTGRDDKLGWGLVDPSQALLDLDAKVARDRGSPQAKAAAPAAARPVAAEPVAAKPAVAQPAAAKPAPISAR